MSGKWLDEVRQRVSSMFEGCGTNRETMIRWVKARLSGSRYPSSSSSESDISLTTRLCGAGLNERSVEAEANSQLDAVFGHTVVASRHLPPCARCHATFVCRFSTIHKYQSSLLSTRYISFLSKVLGFVEPRGLGTGRSRALPQFQF